MKNQEQEVEQLRVQLTACSVAALGGTENIAKQDDYGWSPAYQDVLNLRRKYEELLTQLRERDEALKNIGKVATELLALKEALTH